MLNWISRRNEDIESGVKLATKYFWGSFVEDKWGRKEGGEDNL